MEFVDTSDVSVMVEIHTKTSTNIDTQDLSLPPQPMNSPEVSQVTMTMQPSTPL